MQGLSAEQVSLRARQDARALRDYARGFERLLHDIGRQDSLWKREPGQPLGADERVLALQLFGRVLDYQVLYGAIAGFHMGFWMIDPLSRPRDHALHFAIAHAAYYSQVLLGLAFVERTILQPQFETLLDEGCPEEGIGPRTYERLKSSVVQAGDFGRIFAAHQYHKLLLLTDYGGARDDEWVAWVIDELDRVYQSVKAKVVDKGVSLLFDNALDLLKDGSRDVWMPIQTEVARWMGDTKVKRLDGGLIEPAQVAQAVEQARTGDLLVERRNWYLSNVGLPGFWPHLALWLGTPSELAAFLNQDPDVLAWAGGPFTARLRSRFPDAWVAFTSPDEAGHPHRVLEAVSEGVVFSSAEHTLDADYAATLRPRLSKLEVARAVERAFEYVGRPYDFDFDFDSDQALVCSELVYKAYEPRSGVQGLRLELTRLLGRTVMTPNGLVAQFDREWGTAEQQLDLVWFLDGSEQRKAAAWSDPAEFRRTHRRTKWDIALD